MAMAFAIPTRKAAPKIWRYLWVKKNGKKPKGSKKKKKAHKDLLPDDTRGMEIGMFCPYFLLVREMKV